VASLGEKLAIHTQQGANIMTNKTAESKKGRHQLTQNLLDDIAKTQRLNIVGIEFLRGIIEDHSDRVYHGVKERPESNLIIRGDLANYCIPLEPILQAFTNPFTVGMGQPMPPIEVHPLGKWVRRHAPACIQPSGDHSDIPGTDSLAILVVALISDRDLFADPSQGPFRNALMHTYGMIQSPVSDLYADYLGKMYGATIDYDAGEISVKGTHGFTWHLGGMKDPEVRSYSLSSSVRGGPQRRHTEDTFHCMGRCKNLRYLLPTLSKSPRIFLEQEDDDLAESKEIMSSVAKHWAPLRGAIESGEIDWGDDE
jgi:hypothetical protein